MSRFLLRLAASAALVGVAWPVAAAGVRVNVATQAGELPDSILVVATCDDPQAEVAAPFQGDSPAILDLDEERVWNVVVRAEGFWAPPRTIWVDGAGADLTVSLRPTGRVRGVLVVPEGEEAPGELRATIQSVVRRFGEQPELGPHVVPCTLIPDSQVFDCELPSGELDVKLRAPGFASRFCWAAKIPARGVLDLGKLVLTRGASVVGWVQGEGPGFDSTEAVVRLLPAGLASSDAPADAPRAALGGTQTHPDERGFFQLAGLVPGAWVVEARHEGRAPAQTSPIRLEEGVEARLGEALELRLPVMVEVRLEPASDPLGRPWQLYVTAKSLGARIREPVAEVQVPPDQGRVRLEQVPAGQYRVMIEDGSGSTWYWRELDVVPGMAPLEVSLPPLPVVGRLFYGDEPLEGVVLLRERKQALRVKVRTDADGRFACELPQPGTWEARVRLGGGVETVAPEPLEISEPAPGSAAEVEIRLPATRVEGVVVDEQGKLQERSLVSVRVQADSGSAGSLLQIEGRADGSFVCIGLPEGTVTLTAEAPGATSDQEELELEDAVPVTGVKLVVRRRKKVLGRVISAAGPVPGALVMVVPRLAGGTPLAPAGQDTTAMDGSFEIGVPAAAVAAELLAFPAGYTAAVQRITLDGRSEEVDIRAEPGGGTLSLRWRPGAEDVFVWRWTPELIVNGAHVSAFAFVQWIGMNPGGLCRPEEQQAVIPAMPPGSYTACLPRHWSPGRLADPEDSSFWTCTSGVLPPYGELTLDLR